MDENTGAQRGEAIDPGAHGYLRQEDAKACGHCTASASKIMSLRASRILRGKGYK